MERADRLTVERVRYFYAVIFPLAVLLRLLPGTEIQPQAATCGQRRRLSDGS